MFYTPHGYSFITTNKFRNFICKSIEIFLSKNNRNCLTIASSKSEYIETIKFNKNAVYVNNGISIKDLSTYKVDKNKLSICTCGRIDHQKNPYLFNEIAKAFPDIEFIWIGDGQLRDVLTSKNIKITGYLKKDKVLKLVKNNKKVEKIDNFKSTPVGYKYQVSFTIFVDGNMSTFDSHEIANKLEKEIEKKIDEVYLCVIHVDPIKKD